MFFKKCNSIRHLQKKSQHFKKKRGIICNSPNNREIKMNSNISVIKTNELLKHLSISRTTLWRMQKAGTFPAPVKANGRAFGWRLKDVESWLDGQK